MVNLALGFAVGASAGLWQVGPDNAEPIDLSDTTAVVGMAVLFPIADALLGTIVGAMQAAILRQVGHDTRMWIGMWAAATCVLFSSFLATLPFLSAPPTPFEEAVSTIVIAGSGMVGAFIMLPALRRLRPRPPAAPPPP